MDVIGRRGQQRDQRPLMQRLRNLLALLQAENGSVLLGDWAQEVLHDTYRSLAASAIQRSERASTLKAFEGLGLWRCVRGGAGKLGVFGTAGPVLPEPAAGDVQFMIELLASTDEALTQPELVAAQLSTEPANTPTAQQRQVTGEPTGWRQRTTLTAQEAASVLGYTRRYVYTLVKDGKLAAATMTGAKRSAIRILRESVEKTLRSKGTVN